MRGPARAAKQTVWRRYRLTCPRYLGHALGGWPWASVDTGLARYRAVEHIALRGFAPCWTVRLGLLIGSRPAPDVDWQAANPRPATVVAISDRRLPIGKRAPPGRILLG